MNRRRVIRLKSANFPNPQTFISDATYSIIEESETPAKYPKGTWIRIRPYERKKERARHQCPYCIATIQEGRLARHILTRHPDKSDEYVGSDIDPKW